MHVNQSAPGLRSSRSNMTRFRRTLRSGLGEADTVQYAIDHSGDPILVVEAGYTYFNGVNQNQAASVQTGSTAAATQIAQQAVLDAQSRQAAIDAYNAQVAADANARAAAQAIQQANAQAAYDAAQRAIALAQQQAAAATTAAEAKAAAAALKLAQQQAGLATVGTVQQSYLDSSLDLSSGGDLIGSGAGTVTVGGVTMSKPLLIGGAILAVALLMQRK